MMSVYLMLTTLTDAGRKALQEEPESVKEINKEVEYMGVKIIDQYALLGQYDFINILEAPSNEVMAKLAIRLSARGSTQTLTLAAISIDDLVTTLKEKKKEPW
ncbi:GYD domain-containing protein [Chloroflexota bacterium]